MFSDDQQRAAVCNAFLYHFGKPPLFHANGPLPEALEYAQTGYPGSSKQADFFRVAWTLWSGDADIGFRELLAGLDRRSLNFLAGFIGALGQTSPDGLNAWLDQVPRPAGQWVCP